MSAMKSLFLQFHQPISIYVSSVVRDSDMLQKKSQILRNF